ncbi:DUF4352 domain-containing protein [Sporolactobacillus terrae]|uniref:DUF4352 domain-containing protein n=1 Tax=Sporolactobacillus terrae TaxID=269673 RepID=A0A410DB38_9BACL|nr:DUF4352 domain-containing protein [Sporolactobacillus terrae]QAA23296.1 DUF4352 domain-containing protein [Sporolactobacillus terrae]QAA26268.1 DUF4352 domain-containing protein [Sporolactobacillus terrae]UAK15362.1 DUF4352 domain-containing protein [Sporolactobacillus terrae]BBN99702.1 hypothetical protein St703_24070 [Sporolactobacillus terrae]
MKRIVGLTISLLLIFTLAACTEDVTVGSGDSSASQTESSSKASKEKIHKQTKLDFTNTAAGQTTKVDSAEIKQVSDLNLIDNEMDQVDFVLLIHMSVSNKAKDEATTYPSQGHVVLEDGTQIDGLMGADVTVDDAFKDGEIASGATKSGYVLFPLKEKQAKQFKKGAFKFDVIAGDEMLTQKNYSVAIQF